MNKMVHGHQGSGSRELKNVQASDHGKFSTKLSAPGIWHIYHITYPNKVRKSYSDAAPCKNVLCVHKCPYNWLNILWQHTCHEIL